MGSVYRHPNSTISDLRTFEDAFVSIMKSFKTNQKYLVLGDLNIHYNKMDTSKHIADYINHINCIGCLQLINKLTRICTTCSSIIDHVYINTTFVSDVPAVILQEDVSDHLPLCVKYCCAPTIKTSQRPYIRRITQESIEPFLSDLDDASLSPDMLHSNDREKLRNLISGLTNQHFPKKIQSRRQYKMAKNPWISPDILALIKCKNKLYAKYLKNRDPSIFNEYKTYRNKIMHIKRKTKQEYFANSFHNASNSSITWNYMNLLLRKGKPKSILPQTIKVDDQTFTSPEKICNKMNQHFATIGEKLAAKSINHDQSKNHLKFLGKHNLSSIVLQPTVAYEIVEIISSLNDHKSPGYLDIPIRIIKEAKFLIAEYLADSFNKSFVSGIYPDVLKIAQLIPLHKGGSI